METQLLYVIPMTSNSVHYLTASDLFLKASPDMYATLPLSAQQSCPFESLAYRTSTIQDADTVEHVHWPTTVSEL